ncbi:hypothetical protein L873DRAFT_1810844 [Choiromyces venosus 120613-1]|uniref:Uncharacterized protein n=1 Tax=Choiromyces venosus 120613-1 TaxID=1336337 RepID=A0A3N4JEY2_9PEZI|nr:hypothetical protein L873DRAFT_1810844 [Choiromyces venosus 120613-1]
MTLSQNSKIPKHTLHSTTQHNTFTPHGFKFVNLVAYPALASAVVCSGVHTVWVGGG